MIEKTPVEIELDRTLLVDEIGIVTATFGPYRLKTTHQPIFRRDGDSLVPFAMEARIAPERDGIAVSPSAFFADVALPQRSFVEALCRRLNLSNVANIGVDLPERYDYYLTIDPRLEASAEPPVEGGSLPRLIADREVPGASLVCEVLDANILDMPTLEPLIGSLRDAGMRVAMAEFRVGGPSIGRVSALKPDIIKIDGGWFRSVQDSAEIAMLFPAVIAGFADMGAQLFVQGIETPQELQAALEAGADHFQGVALARAAVAGAVVDEKPRSIEALLRPLRKVVSFGRPTHQKR